MAKKTTAKPEYVLTLTLGDKTYKATGDTVLAALKKLNKPDKIMNKGLITLQHGNLKSQQMLWPARLKRLFYSPSFQAVQAKMLERVGLKPV